MKYIETGFEVSRVIPNLETVSQSVFVIASTQRVRGNLFVKTEIASFHSQ